ncbi:MAG: hypothetical protein J6T40_03160 [Clostridiales bacterium]|nr:hypothetical protein [Clostridiales bacterium]
MSFAKSKNDFSKKDMNFFSEFTSAASQQISSAIPVFLLLTVILLVFTLIVWIYCGVQVMNKQNKINDLRAIMASADYQNRLKAKDRSQAEVEELRQYQYVLSTLDSKVSNKVAASSSTMAKCRENLTDDMYLTYYDDADGIVEIKGNCKGRESAYNYLEKLRATELFEFMETQIVPQDPIELGYDKDSLMFGSFSYTFDFKCYLKGHYSLTWASFLDGTVPTALTALNRQSFSAGSDYKIPDIDKLTVDGVNYKLTNVKINGTAVSASQLSDILKNKELSGKITSNMNVELMYAVDNGGES